MPPMVEAITNKIGKAPVTAVNFSDNDLRRPGGPASGRNQQMMLTVITKMAKSKSPGKTPAHPHVIEPVAELDTEVDLAPA